MSKPFDVTMKELLETHVGDSLSYLGVSVGDRLDMIDTDLSTVTTQADKVIRVHAPTPWLVHVEFQANYDKRLGQRLLQYNVLLTTRHALPVQSVVVLLRPEADGPDMTGQVSHAIQDGPPYLTFQYKTVRAWKKPAREVLEGGIGMLPLAPLSNVKAESVPAMIRRMEERLAGEVSPEQAAKLWTATYVLMGLRYPAAFCGANAPRSPRHERIHYLPGHSRGRRSQRGSERGSQGRADRSAKDSGPSGDQALR